MRNNVIQHETEKWLFVFEVIRFCDVAVGGQKYREIMYIEFGCDFIIGSNSNLMRPFNGEISRMLCATVKGINYLSL